MSKILLKKVLKEQGRSQTWLADQVGKHKGTVNRWCTGEDVPSIETLYEIAQILDVSIYELLENNKTEKE